MLRPCLSCSRLPGAARPNAGRPDPYRESVATGSRMRAKFPPLGSRAASRRDPGAPWLRPGTASTCVRHGPATLPAQSRDLAARPSRLACIPALRPLFPAPDVHTGKRDELSDTWRDHRCGPLYLARALSVDGRIVAGYEKLARPVCLADPAPLASRIRQTCRRRRDRWPVLRPGVLAGYSLLETPWSTTPPPPLTRR